MALAHAATATHAIAEIQAAEDTLKDALIAEARQHDENVGRLLDSYHYSVKAALGRYAATMATIGGMDDDDEED